MICRTLLLNLLKNEDYRDYFLQRAAWQVNNLWTEENINGRIDEIYGLIAQDMKKDIARWRKNYEYWQGQVDYMRTYAAQRNRFFVSHIKGYFHLNDQQMKEYGFPISD